MAKKPMLAGFKYRLATGLLSKKNWSGRSRTGQVATLFSANPKHEKEIRCKMV